MRTNAGRDLAARQQFDTASNATGSYAAATYIGLTENSTAPAAGNTSLAAELNQAGGGLNRAQATYAHTNGTNLVSLTKTFTANASDVPPKTPAKAALFNAAGPPVAGTEAFETLIDNPPPMQADDSMAVTWDFTL